MTVTKAEKRRPRCIVCDTFSPEAREFIDRAFSAGFNRNEIRDKLKTSMDIIVSSDSVWNHWSNHVRG